jgi:hypothetical protein
LIFCWLWKFKAVSMLKQILLIAGSSIFMLLGVAHLYYTFINNKFEARDASVTEGMKNTHPLLTRQTTMWKAWMGFNGSHSLGAIFFGCINLVLALQYYPILATSKLIAIVDIGVCLCYLVLGIKYWFKTPVIGIALATACFILAGIL